MRCTADFAHDDPLASWSTKTSCFLHVKNWVEKHICFRGHMGTEKSKGFQHKIFGKASEKKIAIFSHLNLNYSRTKMPHLHAWKKGQKKRWYFAAFDTLGRGIFSSFKKWSVSIEIPFFPPRCIILIVGICAKMRRWELCWNVKKNSGFSFSFHFTGWETNFLPFWFFWTKKFRIWGITVW